MSKLSSTTPYNLSLETQASSAAATAPVTMNTVSSSNNNNSKDNNNNNNGGINHYFQPRRYTSNRANNPLNLLVGVVGYNVTYGMWDYIQPSEALHPLYGEFPKFKFGDDHAQQHHKQFKLDSPVVFEGVDDIFWNEFYVSLSKAMQSKRILQIIFSTLQPPFFFCLILLYNWLLDSVFAHMVDPRLGLVLASALFFTGLLSAAWFLVLLERQIDIVQNTAIKYKDPFAERGVNLEFVIHSYPGCGRQQQYSYYIVFMGMMPNKRIMEVCANG
jgi:hypothetical protein